MGMSPAMKGKKGRFGPAGVAPAVTIYVPENGATYSTDTNLPLGSPVGSPIVLTPAASVVLKARAGDDLTGDLSDSIVWTSNIDGALGTGKSITALLTVGTHRVRATASDGTLSGFDAVEIIVT